VLRLPPDGALYHRHGNELVDRTVEKLRGEGATIVVLARTTLQRDAWRARAWQGVMVAEPPVDTRSLMLEADLFVGAGGTMTREAAVLGVPTWSIFAGLPAAVDHWLVDQGRLELVDSQARLDALPFPPDRPKTVLPPRDEGLLSVLLETMAEVA
jgi:predicted glycosyltransferase